MESVWRQMLSSFILWMLLLCSSVSENLIMTAILDAILDKVPRGQFVLGKILIIFRGCLENLKKLTLSTTAYVSMAASRSGGSYHCNTNPYQHWFHNKAGSQVKSPEFEYQFIPTRAIFPSTPGKLHVVLLSSITFESRVNVHTLAYYKVNLYMKFPHQHT